MYSKSYIQVSNVSNFQIDDLRYCNVFFYSMTQKTKLNAEFGFLILRITVAFLLRDSLLLKSDHFLVCFLFIQRNVNYYDLFYNRYSHAHE